MAINIQYEVQQKDEDNIWVCQHPDKREIIVISQSGDTNWVNKEHLGELIAVLQNFISEK